MQNYCNIVKNKFNMIIRNMEKKASAFMVDPKRDFIRKSDLSFSKTMRFILGMGTYAYLRVRMLFAPPLSSAVADAMNRQISELEWRLSIQESPE